MRAWAHFVRDALEARLEATLLRQFGYSGKNIYFFHVKLFLGGWQLRKFH
jgi:hypothetical protein